MDQARRLRIAAAIASAARLEGPPIRPHHVCEAAVGVVGVSGVSLSVVGDLGFAEAVCATDAVSEHAAELETILGVGPVMDVLTQGDPVLVADVSWPSTSCRWPRLDAALSPLGVVGLFAFPLFAAEETVGVLELYRTRPGVLTSPEVADSEVLAEAAMELIVDMGAGDPGRSHGLLLGPLDPQWATIYQAVGVVSSQLHSGSTDAYVRLRAHAFLSGRRLLPTAEAVLAGDLRFSSDRW